MKAKMVRFHIPDDQAFLAAVGRVALGHAHLDHVLRLAIKTLAGTTVSEARLATAGYSSAALRDEVRVLGKKALGDGPAYVMLRSMLTTAKLLSKRRNDLMHGIFAQEIDTDAESNGLIFQEPIVLNEELESAPPPTTVSLIDLAKSIENHVDALNGFRISGFRAHSIPALSGK
ncbi:MAG: hypothetical protein K8F93_00375 [Burkholderiales bacterium]|nr:hypothetical protein [Burkholderiales bacterium]